jgi:hypothetical protein
LLILCPTWTKSACCLKSLKVVDSNLVLIDWLVVPFFDGFWWIARPSDWLIITCIWVWLVDFYPWYMGYILRAVSEIEGSCGQQLIRTEKICNCDHYFCTRLNRLLNTYFRVLVLFILFVIMSFFSIMYDDDHLDLYSVTHVKLWTFYSVCSIMCILIRKWQWFMMS